MKKTHAALIFLILPLMLFAGGSGENTSSAHSSADAVFLELTDSYGNTVVFEESPQRVVSIGPNITEFVFALGEGDRLVGRSEFDDYPAAALQVPTVGSMRTPNVERIVELDPDVVLISTHFDAESQKVLQQLGIKVLALYNDESFEGVYEIAAQLGSLFDAEERAQQLIDEMRETVAKVDNAVAEVEDRPTVYYVVGFGESGDYTAGGDTFIGQMIQRAGGENIASDISGWAYSFEKIVEHNPDVIICSQYFGISESLMSQENYASLRAIEEGNLVPIDNNMIDRQGPRLAQGLLELAKAINPGLFEN